MEDQSINDTATFQSPIGPLQVRADLYGITSINFLDEITNEKSSDVPLIRMCIEELTQYFERQRSTFSVPINPSGSAFQLSVWETLQTIPFGRTITYLELARKLGDSKKTRAVGNANGKNPIPIIIPCHRVIGKNGALIGYAGGLHRKKWLINLEHPVLQPELFQDL